MTGTITMKKDKRSTSKKKMSKPTIDKIALLKLTRDRNLKKWRRKVLYLPETTRTRNRRVRKVVSQHRKRGISRRSKRWKVKENKRESRCNPRAKMKSKNKRKRNLKSKLSPKDTAQFMEEEI